jgi:hypothetical protein
VRRWWIAIGGGALLALAALVPALAAKSRPAPPVTVELVGSLTIAWQGDQTRGCAAEGLCGVSGSLQMLPGGTMSSSPGPPPLELSDQASVARVIERSASGATESTCADLVPVDVVFHVADAGGLRAVVDPGGSGQLPSAGRCAGPTAGDLSALTLPARKLGSHGYDFSGQTSFGAGPFTVTVASTVRALFSRGLTGLGGIGVLSTSTTSTGVVIGTPVPKLPTRLQEHAELDYRVKGLTGALTTTFAGLAPPLCDALGACRTTGTVHETFTAGGVVSFIGMRMVKHRVGTRAALADLRAGRLGVYDSFQGLPIEETATETLTGPDGATCSDRRLEGPFRPAPSPTRGHVIELKLTGGQQPFFFGGGGLDAFRTRCPGPSAADVLGTSPLAAATLPVSALGAHALTITLGGGGSFTASAYAGKRAGSLVLSLVLEHARGGTSRVPVFPRPGVLP